MTRKRIGSLVLRAYPRKTQRARGAEMLSMLLDAGEESSLTFTRECWGLVLGGLRERSAITARRLRGRHTAIVVAMMIAAVSAVYISNDTSGPANNESNMRAIAGEVVPYLYPGDLVIVAQTDQTPLAAHYLPVGLRYFIPTRPGDLPKLTYRERQIYSRLVGSDPRAALDRLLKSLMPGQHVLFIRPLTEASAAWPSHLSVFVRRRAAQWGAVLARDPELRFVTWAPRKYQGSCCVTDSALLYVKS